MPRLTIRAYLLLGFSLLATLPVLMLGLSITQQLGAGEVTDAQLQLDTVASTLSDAISQYLDIRAAELDGFARQIEAQPVADPKVIESLIVRKRIQSGHFTYLAIGDRAGSTQVADPEPTQISSSSDAFAAMRKTGAASLTWPDVHPLLMTPALRMTSPMWAPNGTLKGYVDGVLDTDDINMFAAGVVRQMADVHAIVFDASGRVIGSHAITPDGLYHLPDLALYVPVHGPDQRVMVDELGVAMRAAVVPVTSHGLSWTILVTTPEATVQEHVTTVQRQTLLLVGLSLIISMLCAAVWAHAFSAPIRRLANYAGAVGRGTSTSRLPTIDWWHPQEVEVLTSQVERMGRYMRERNEDLELLVSQRTAALRTSEAYFRALIENSSDLIVVLDQVGLIQYASPSHQVLLAIAPEDMIGRRGIEFVHEDDVPTLQQAVRTQLDGGVATQTHVFRFRHLDGSWRWLESVVSIGPSSINYGVVVNSRDITERKSHEAALEHFAMHDELTQLPNRRHLHVRLGAMLLAAHRAGTPVSLLLLDLNRFKEINDTLGHEFGDSVLAAVGERLVRSVRSADVVARLGGDEFAIVLPDTAADKAVQIADSLNQALDVPLTLNNETLVVGSSIGVVAAPEHGTDASDLLRRADVAMYMAKRAGAGASLYSAEYDRQSAELLNIAARLRKTIVDGGLDLHYQIKGCLASKVSIGVEALVRWNDPQLGRVSPDRFIPIAEETGLIVPLTDWVFETALSQLREWLDAGLDLTMAVNVSTRSLNSDDLPEMIGALLERHNVAAERLRLEVTESGLMTDPGRAIAILSRLRDAGIGIAIDDFGTGYSSLAHLKRLPADELKIDRSFVRDMAHDDDDAAIVRTTIQLGHQLGLTVVAEGIEDAATWERLVALGCDVGQGYFYARPEPAARVTARLMSEATTASAWPNIAA